MRRNNTNWNVTQIVSTASAPFIVQSSIIFYQIFFSPLKMVINCIHTIYESWAGKQLGEWEDILLDISDNINQITPAILLPGGEEGETRC